MLHNILFAAGGWFIGCFTPAIGREVKSWLVKESTTVKTDIKAAVKKV